MRFAVRSTRLRWDRARSQSVLAALAPFEQADTGDFYRRVTVVAELLGKVASERLLVVVGPSGIGKSSVIKAGLVPASAVAPCPVRSPG